MAIYTTMVRSICESLAGWSEDGTYDQASIIENSREKIFDFDYPKYSDAQKKVLETNILKHYYFEEIGFETYMQWKLKMNSKLNEIMPKYVKLYELVANGIDPFIDTNYTRTKKENNDIDSSGTNTGNLSEDTTSNGTALDLYSDTPQGGITGLEEGNYLTNADKTTTNNTQNTTQSNTSSSTGKENETKDLNETIKGKRSMQSYTSYINEYLSSGYYNVDEMIIKDLEDLFFGLWR